MILDMRCFGLPKAGNAPEEYEDAYGAYSDATLRCNRAGAWQIPVSTHPTRLAAADGATETSFSGIWAKILVRQYCNGRLDEHTTRSDSLARCRQIWQRSVSRKPLPWYAEQKLEMGAYAALVGLSLAADNGSLTGWWRACALGDSCLFQFRRGQLIASFPMERWEDFSSRPILLSSVAPSHGAEPVFQDRKGNWEVGDDFYLATDAISMWLLRSWHLRDADPYYELQSIATCDDLQQFVSLQRRDFLGDGAPRMRNDDVTIVRCTVLPS